jgi:hypothetical protein
MPSTRRLLTTADWWQLSDGEIHYVWWFVQGSIMEPDVRWRLRHAWGLCERHAWGALAAEAAFRHNYFHGPAILYQDLMERGRHALDLIGPLSAPRVARRLRPRGPCLMCDMGLSRSSTSTAKPELIAQGRDLTMIREFAALTRELWWSTVCGKCRGDDSPARCRPHLAQDARDGAVGDLAFHRTAVTGILERVTAYCRSYRWECRGTDTDSGRAALVSAVGWCSGWHGALVLLG